MVNWFRTADVTRDTALPGRIEPVSEAGATHTVLGTPLDDVPAGSEVAYFAMGCFWGAEKLFWQVPGVVSTSVGYQGGFTPNPTYKEVCTGRTGHTETVRVVFDPEVVTYRDLLKVFFENHDPTQGDRQGNDVGTQYRSEIFTTSPEQDAAARSALVAFQPSLSERGYGPITTRIADAAEHPFYFAEDYHQQYLDKVPNGYCPIHATGVACNI
jgi:peptide-methionine (S)-S-oxide reductase